MSKILILLLVSSVVLFGCASTMPEETSNTNDNVTPQSTTNDPSTSLDAPEVELKDGQYITLVGSDMINMDNTVFINY